MYSLPLLDGQWVLLTLGRRSPALPHPQEGQIKGDRGRVLIVGGGLYHGAPILAGMAAARMGVDLVHVAMPSQAAARAKWPSELIQEKMTDYEYISDISALVKRCMTGRGVQAMVIGPGMGDNSASLEAVKMLIRDSKHSKSD